MPPRERWVWGDPKRGAYRKSREKELVHVSAGLEAPDPKILRLKEEERESHKGEIAVV